MRTLCVRRDEEMEEKDTFLRKKLFVWATKTAFVILTQ